MKKGMLFHAGTEESLGIDQLLPLLDRSQVELEVVDLNIHPYRLSECREFGVQFLPALVIEGQVYHVNSSTPIHELQGRYESSGMGQAESVSGAAAVAGVGVEASATSLTPGAGQPPQPPMIEDEEAVESTTDLEVVEAGRCRGCDCDYC